MNHIERWLWKRKRNKKLREIRQAKQYERLKEHVTKLVMKDPELMEKLAEADNPSFVLFDEVLGTKEKEAKQRKEEEERKQRAELARKVVMKDPELIKKLAEADIPEIVLLDEIWGRAEKKGSKKRRGKWRNQN